MAWASDAGKAGSNPAMPAPQHLYLIVPFGFPGRGRIDGGFGIRIVHKNRRTGKCRCRDHEQKNEEAIRQSTNDSEPKSCVQTVAKHRLANLSGRGESHRNDIPILRHTVEFRQSKQPGPDGFRRISIEEATHGTPNRETARLRAIRGSDDSGNHVSAAENVFRTHLIRKATGTSHATAGGFARSNS